MPKKYTLELSPAAKRDLKRLPLSVQKNIVFTHLPAIEADSLSTSMPLLAHSRRNVHIILAEIRNTESCFTSKTTSLQ